MRREVGLAWSDLRHDSAHFVCAIILIASIAGVFLVLLGMKGGAIAVLLSDLRDDPSNAEVMITGAHVFTLEDVDRVRTFEGVGFAAGQNIVTTTGRLRLVRSPDGSQSHPGSYATTGPGDPYTARGATLEDDSLILSTALARRLAVEPGDRVRILLERGLPDERSVEPEFTIADILDETLDIGNLVLLNASTLDRIEAFGLGYAIPQWGVDTGYDLAGRVNTFEKIRIYAARLEALPDLVERIERTFGIRTTSNAGRVRAILTLERNLNAALAFITGAGAVGLFFVLAAHFWSAVRRKRLSWSMLSLMGAMPRTLAAIPVLQALIVSLAGYLGGVALFFAVLTLINYWFRPFLEQGKSVAELSLATLALVGVGMMVISAIASAAAAAAVLQSDPAEVIRRS